MKYLLCFLLLILIKFSYCQNLVTNGDFENNNGCTSGGMPVSVAPPWNPIGNTGYLCTCCNGINSYYGVPININGNGSYQWPRSGNSYVGINTYLAIGNNLREYIWASLIDTLKAGKNYCVEFYVNLCNLSKQAHDAIGARFTTTPYTCPGFNCFYADTPQVMSPLGVAITDTLNWTKISGSFIAKGGERYITIGNFLPDSLLTVVNADTSQQYSTLYFIDDVSVTKCDSTNAIENISLEKGVSIFPNPTNNFITVSVKKKILELVLYELSGKIILQEFNSTYLTVSGVSDGMYLLKCLLKDEQIIYKKFVVQH